MDCSIDGYAFAHVTFSSLLDATWLAFVGSYFNYTDELADNMRYTDLNTIGVTETWRLKTGSKNGAYDWNSHW